MSARELNNRIEYMVTCIGDFAARYAMAPAAAYAFLERYQGLSSDRLLRCRAYAICSNGGKE